MQLVLKTIQHILNAERFQILVETPFIGPGPFPKNAMRALVLKQLFWDREPKGQLRKNNLRKLRLFSYPSVETCVLGAQKNRLIATVLLSTHNICFG